MKFHQLHGDTLQNRYAGASRNIDSSVAKAEPSYNKAYHLSLHLF